jgi:hypothetical protein
MKRRIVFVAVLCVLCGAYIPSVSNLLVEWNLIVPAGKPQLVTLPFAYPAVGVDIQTLASLTGLLLFICAIHRWITYIEHAAKHE